MNFHDEAQRNIIYFLALTPFCCFIYSFSKYMYSKEYFKKYQFYIK